MEEAVSTFIVNTSCVKQQPNSGRFHAWTCNLRFDGWTSVHDERESYMDFMLDDASDRQPLMWRSAHSIVVPSLQRLPARLPATFDDVVTVYLIVDNGLPGFTRLLQTSDQLRILPGSNDEYVRLPLQERSNTFGYVYRFLKSVSSPPISTRCLEWPSQAADWPRRRRPFGWPDDPTVRLVVASGCDLTDRWRHVCDGVHEPDLKSWNFVFPDAEALLLNTWTPAQQTVYHVLSFVVRLEFDRYRCADGYRIVSVQILKAVMLWLSETRSVDWWTHSNILRTCAAVMQLLMEVYERRCCYGYFITKANLIECSRSQSIVRVIEQFVDVNYFTHWIANNYVPRSLERCPHSGVQPLDSTDIVTYENMKHKMAEAAEWRNQQAGNQNLCKTQTIVLNLPSVIGKAKRMMNLKSVVSWRKDFLEIDLRFDSYFTSVVCLTMATALKEINSSAVPDDVCDIVAAMATGIEKSNKMSFVQMSDEFLLKKAMYLLRLSWQSSCQVTNSILLVLAHVYMRRARMIRPKTAERNYVCHRADVYLAVLYYMAGRYDAAEITCIRASYSGTQTTASDVAEGQYLHNIDNGTDVVSGVILLYQFTKNAPLLGPTREASRADVFSAELFARHLRLVIRSASGRTVMTSYLVQQYTGHVRRTLTLHCGDMMLYYLDSTRKTVVTCNLDKTKQRLPVVRFSARELRRLLVEFAFRQIAQFQRLLSHDYSPEIAAADATVRAMRAYQCGYYEKCLRLSEQTVSALWDKGRFYIMPTYGCMNQLLDDDLASMAGIFILVSQSICGYITHRTLSLYLLVQSRLGLRKRTTFSKRSTGDALKRIQTYVLHWPSAIYTTDDDIIALHFVYRKAVIRTQRHSAAGGM